MKPTFLLRRRLGIHWMLLSVITLAKSLAAGQEPSHSFDELKQNLTIGDTVQVIACSGNKSQGKVVDISASSLVLKSKEGRLVLPENSVREVKKKQRDLWWNGVLIGGGVGAAAGLIIARKECGGSDPECTAIAGPAFVLPGISIGAAAGALIDYSVKKFETIFTAAATQSQPMIRLSPILSRQQKGVHLSFSF
jgi:hypothetical protein